MGWLTSLLGFLDKLFAFINTQQLKKAGKDELRVEQNEMDNQARAEAKKTKADIANLSDDDLDERLRKWKR